MKMTLKHTNIPSTNKLDSWVEEQVLPLGQERQIDEANIELIRHVQGSPAYEARVHLVTPGPDIFAQARDHTIRAACEKAWAQLRKAIASRAAKAAEQTTVHQSPATRIGRSRLNTRTA
jgi:ribosome-associated translation inhibitor RaiA